ncbi:hypothetical protein BY996DRAFT_6606424 [Phakopsora pachyrhizi]|nr:hypothetical protein BY996DRAFT_6606424 [Phakopsora pachyrhizi]
MGNPTTKMLNGRMSFDCFNGDWKWHTTVTINKALINQMRLDILVGNQLKDEIYKPFELLDPDQRLEGSYDVQTIEGKVWRNLCWITSRVTLERARNVFDSNYLEENWEVDPNREFVDLVILRLPTMPYGHSSRKRDDDNTRVCGILKEDKKGKMTYAQTEKVRSADYCDKRLQSKSRQEGASGLMQGQVFFARDQLENGRDIEGERVEVSRMKRMRMEVKTTYIYKAKNVTKGSSQEMGLAKVCCGGCSWIEHSSKYSRVIDEAGEELVLPIKGMKVGSGMAKDTKRMGVMEEAQQLLCSSRRQSEAL